MLGYPNAYNAADHVPEILTHKPIGLEGFDSHLVENMRKKQLQPDNIVLLPEGGGWLLVEFGSETKQEADDQARATDGGVEACDGPSVYEALCDPREAQRVWLVREAALGATVFVPGEPLGWEGWEDAAVPPEKLGELPSGPLCVDGPLWLYLCPVWSLWPGMCPHTHQL